MFVLVRITHHIVVVAVPDQGVGAEGVFLSAVMEHTLLLHVVFDLPEPNLLMLVDGFVDGVDDVEDLLIFQLSPAVHHHIALQIPSLINTGQSGDLFDEGIAFFFGDEFGGGNGVDHGLQLGDLEFTLQVAILVLGRAPLIDAEPGLLQHLDVALDGGPVGLHAVALLQNAGQLGGGQIVVLIRALLQDLQKIQRSQFGVDIHGVTP